MKVYSISLSCDNNKYECNCILRTIWSRIKFYSILFYSYTSNLCRIWIFILSRLSDSAQSNPSIKNYCLIIIAFSRPYFSIYDIFIQKKAHLISFIERATHLKIIQNVTNINISLFKRPSGKVAGKDTQMSTSTDFQTEH